MKNNLLYLITILYIFQAEDANAIDKCSAIFDTTASITEHTQDSHKWGFLFNFFRVNKVNKPILESSNWEDYPFIEYRELNAKFLEVQSGANNKGLAEGELNGKPVFIKILPRPEEIIAPNIESLNEYQWLRFLNDLGLGPKVYGVTQFAGRFAVVMDLVHGENTQFYRGPIAESALRDIRLAARILQSAGIKYAFDLQFILTEDGRAVLIDPEMFTFSKGNYYKPLSPTQQAEYLIKKVQEEDTRRF